MHTLRGKYASAKDVAARPLFLPFACRLWSARKEMRCDVSRSQSGEQVRLSAGEATRSATIGSLGLKAFETLQL